MSEWALIYISMCHCGHSRHTDVVRDSASRSGSELPRRVADAYSELAPQRTVISVEQTRPRSSEETALGWGVGGVPILSRKQARKEDGYM